MTEPNFLGKFSFAQIWAKRAQKWTFLNFLKIQSLLFSDILQLEDYKGYKTDLGRFFGKFLFAKILSKSPQNEFFRLLLKIGHSSFVDIWCAVTGHETLRNGLCMFLKKHAKKSQKYLFD